MPAASERRTACWLLAGLLLLGGTGCTTVMRERERHRPPLARGYPIIKPVVAVIDFDNRSNFSGQWKLGGGMAEVLMDLLLQSGKFTLLERQRLPDLIGEIKRQGQELFRPEGRVPRGRLRNAQYLIRGAVTDSTVTGDLSGCFGQGTPRVLGRHQRARVALTLIVSDVASGEILVTASTSAHASSGLLGGAVDYKGVSFGGELFFRTPLGRATRQATERAVREIIRGLPRTYWTPQVAEGGPDQVIVNGGQNVRLRVGDRFLVRETGREITDPVTGNVIERLPGRVKGRLQITEVRPLAAQAVLLEGAAVRGDLLEAER
ncbi:MAG: CsgG/HfaB family protein [Candidatus Marinimicrobia bacterium]|nr:CsgG/HfaB family protein [Candidatus Neomarinimicrobiota bacterium]